MKFVLLLIAVIFWLVGTQLIADGNANFNAWTARCNHDGGAISQTHKGFFDTQYECFKNGHIIDHEN